MDTKMTPYEIGILLHYYVSPVDPDDEKYARNELWSNTIEWMMDGVVLLDFDKSENNRTYCLTERGRVYVEQGLMQVPLPVQSWHMPKILPTAE